MAVAVYPSAGHALTDNKTIRRSREFADAVFEVTLKQEGVSLRLARAMGFAVSAFGWRRPKA